MARCPLAELFDGLAGGGREPVHGSAGSQERRDDDGAIGAHRIGQRVDVARQHVVVAVDGRRDPAGRAEITIGGARLVGHGTPGGSCGVARAVEHRDTGRKPRLGRGTGSDPPDNAVRRFNRRQGCHVDAGEAEQVAIPSPA